MAILAVFTPALTISENVMKTISSFALGFVCCALLILMVAPSEVVAQETEDPTLAYVAYFKVSYADLEEWISLYHEHSVPILQQLQEEGVINGWGVWQHSTGGEYNWRFSVRTAQWVQLGQFWEEYLGRLQERSAEAFARNNAMIQAHYDEVWDITEVHFPDPAPEAAYLYDSLFQIGFGELGEWGRIWSESVGPMLDQAMEDGLLGGWVVLGHNTGGRYNWKVLYFFEEWDVIDDFFEGLLGQLMSEGLWQEIGSRVEAHTDVIWAGVPDPAEFQ